MSPRSLLTAVLTLAVTALLVIYAFWDADLAALGALLAAGDYRVLAPFLVMEVAFFWFTAWRWVLILRPLGRFTVGQVIPAMMIGFGGNNVLPAHLGELVRTVVFAGRYRRSRSGVLMTLVLERVLDVLAILLLGLVAILTLESYPEGLRGGLRASAAVLGLLLAVILVFLRYPAPFTRAWRRLSRPLPERLRGLGERFLAGSEAGLSALKSPVAAGALIGLSLLKWAAAGGMAWLAVYGYGVAIPPGVAALVIAVTALAVTVPSVPGFFGVVQAAFVFALTPFGVSREVALAASVFFLLAQWVPVTLTGLAFFLATGLGVTRLRREMEEPAG